MAVHQVSCFCKNPKRSHEQAVCQIVKHLKGTKDEGTIIRPNKMKVIQCYADADFAGGFHKDISEDPSTIISQTGYTIKYTDHPILWVSKLQNNIVLSSTESEYVALSMAMRDVIPLINLVEEVRAFLPIETTPPMIKCKVFEDNQSCIKVAKAQALTLRMKHIAVRYHYFRSMVENRKVEIEYCPTMEMVADMLTKPLPDELFKKHRKEMLGR